MIKGYVKAINKASKLLENVAVIFIFITAMLVLANVISRRAFNMPIVGTQDLVLFFTTAAIALSISYCAVRDGHVFISVLVERFSKKVQKIVDIIIGIISAVFLLFVTWHMILYANTMRLSGEVSMTIRFPHYPFVFILAIGFGMLALVVIGKVLSQFLKEGDQ